MKMIFTRSASKSRRKRPAAIGAALCLTFLATATAGAHDFWLVPDAFRVAAGAPLLVYGQTGTSFPTSVSAVSADRIADGRIIGAAGTERLGDFSQAGTSLVIRHRPHGDGQRVIAVAIVPRTTRQSAEGFQRYLMLEGAAEEAAEYARLGTLPRDSISMRSAKFAKTIVQVGRGGPLAFNKLAGHGLEIVPLANPLALNPGARAQFRVLAGGNPLPGAHAHAGVGASRAGDSAIPDLTLTADGSGIITVPVERSGIWNLRVVHAAPSAAGSGADWDVHFATLVFAVGGENAARFIPTPPPAQSDTAAALEAVMAFGRAIAAGDTSAAMRLLAPDVVILEGGGIQSRAEYASHHLTEDIAFRKAVPAEITPIRVVVSGDVAWASSTSVSKGEMDGRPINSGGAELMVLSRNRTAGADGPAWQIRAIHWSSRRRTQ